MPHVGAPLKRLDDPRLLTGRGRYVDDITLPRMVHVAFVRSSHAHATITDLDVSAAAHASGVVRVLTGIEAARLCKPYRGILHHYRGMKTGAMQPLAVERVRCVGEPVVAIAAESAAAAHDAAACVRVQYALLPAVLDPDAATAPGAPVIHPELGDNVMYETRLNGGEPDAAFASALRIWRRRFTTGRHTGVPLEPRALVADFEPATRALTVWISTQVPHMMQAVLAELFALPEHRVRVIAPDVGGSFGIKIHVYQDDLAAIALVLALGRPVTWVATRRESFVSDIHAREQTIDVEVVAGEDGVVSAMRARITAAVGPYSAYPRSSVVEGGQVLRLLPGPYRLRHYDGALRVVAQNKVITSQYRAVGHPIATAVTESMLDTIARDVGLDPAEVRRRNLVRSDELPYTSATGNVYDSGSYHAALARLLDVAKYDDLRREQQAARAQGRHMGIGLSCFIELTGPGAQYGIGGAPISGQDAATLLASRALAEKVRRVAATLLEAHAEDIELADGRARPRCAGSWSDARRARARRAFSEQRAEGCRAHARRDRALHERPAVDVHERRASRRRRRRRRDRAGPGRTLRHGGRLRSPRESRARRGPDRRRHGPGPRRRAYGALRVRRCGPPALRHADGGRAAHRDRRSRARATSPADAHAVDRGRLQGRR